MKLFIVFYGVDHVRETVTTAANIKIEVTCKIQK
jgi:hypothetical protein